ncbi:hypothetical protein L1887_05906 [Cichorium endivia]|nr:hypothetical protein L1887_05906 [Cichorium endivia]
MRAVLAELEEKRNAATIAADESMAMITRLQEEKASLHMEALQYLRMMDEQADYDMEALDKANDLVAEKDKEIQDLEAELEYFRSRYEDELVDNTNTNTKSTNNDYGNVPIWKANKIGRIVLPFKRSTKVASSTFHSKTSTFAVLPTQMGIVETCKGSITNGYNSYCTRQHSTMSDCEGKSSWPELVGENGQAAAAKIEKENPRVDAIVLLDGTPTTRDFRCDRVWVWVNSSGVVLRSPKIG